GSLRTQSLRALPEGLRRSLGGGEDPARPGKRFGHRCPIVLGEVVQAAASTTGGAPARLTQGALNRHRACPGLRSPQSPGHQPGAEDQAREQAAERTGGPLGVTDSDVDALALHALEAGRAPVRDPAIGLDPPGTVLAFRVVALASKIVRAHVLTPVT